MINKMIKKAWRYISESAIEGKLLTDLWKKAWKEVDRLIGICARFFLRKRTPIKQNKIFFHTQEGKYCCNPKYISEEFRKQGFKDLDIVWKSPPNSRGGIPSDFRIAPFNKTKYFKELFSSKVVVTNSFLFLGVPVKLKKDQILLQTWHGSKKKKKYGVNDIQDYWRRVKALKQTGDMTSYCISNSDLENHSFRDHYWPNTPIVEYGHARNDLFFDNHTEDRAKLRKKIFQELGIDSNTRVIMYGPTFRDDKSLEYYEIDFKRLIETVQSRFGGTWCVFLRYHPSMAKEPAIQSEMMQLRNLAVYNVTDYEDMQELIAVTDIAITDYSSWIYDFVLLRKPGFIFATDLADYDQERGFYYPIETTPFPISADNDKLMADIMTYDEKEYREKVEAFLKDKGCIDDGHAAERVVRMIRQLIKNEEPEGVIRA